LAAAVDYAGSLGVKAISNSYGGGEFSGEDDFANAHYNKPGIVITVSTGDAGYGVEFPAAASSVVAVGGTALNRGSNGVWSETAWSGAGSGCSSYVPKPNWQGGIATTCGNRMVADIAAVADPNTGVRVYTTGSSGTTWYVFGGTSVAAPIIAAGYTRSTGSTSDASSLYGGATGLYDVVSGSNGRCTIGRNATNALLCTAGTGWDGPTGNGTPRGGAIKR